MTHSRKRQLAPFVVLAAASIAAGSAYAASKLTGTSPSLGTAGPLSATSISSTRGGHAFGDRHGRHGDDLAAAAAYLGIPQADLLTSLQSGKTLAQIAGATSGKTVSGLIDALVAAEKAELTAAVTAGRLTQAQSDQIATGLTAHVTAEVNGTLPAHGPGGPGFGHGHGGDELTAAAAYLGVTEAALATQLQSGKTLAQIADATSGKSAAGLVDALVAAEKTELATAVTAGTITQEQSDQIATTLKARFTALVNGTAPSHGRRDGGLRPGFAPRGAPPVAPTDGTHI
jgi:urease accessory protein UreF